VVADRMSGAINRVAAGLEPGQLAVVVSHGAALRIGMERVLGLPAEGIGVLGPLANCSWSVLSVADGHWRLLEYNAGTLPEPVIGDDR
jgi:broad specificity phosphatase PhoE